ncbi:MAG: amidohydrolase [Proteobacteria bacterium]|nr:amidohydrolase [Pseudomonadota bacterium]
MKSIKVKSSIIICCLLLTGICASQDKTPQDKVSLKTVDLMIINAQVLTMNKDKEVYQNGVIVIKGNRIIAIGANNISLKYTAKKTIDADGDIAMPGMINLHNHIPMVAFRGLGENGVKDRLFKFFFPLEKELLSRDLIRVASHQAAMELALSGVTLVTDMYYHEDEVAKSVAQVGIRGVLGETVIQFPVVDAPEPYGGFQYAKNFISKWKNHPLITPAIAPHATYTVTPEWLLKSKELAEKENVPMLVHVTESAGEKKLISERINPIPENKSIIEYLEDIDFLSDKLLAAHVIFLDKNDMQILKKYGVGIAHNPKANSRAATGMSPAWEMYKMNLDIGLGTDGPMSSNQMDIFNVMGYAASVARTASKDDTRFTPYELVDMATMGGARALDIEDEIGSLEVGKKADIVIVDTDAANTQPNYNPYATIAFAAYPQNVTHTIVDGKVIVENGILKTIDIKEHNKQWIPLTEKVAEFAKSLE